MFALQLDIVNINSCQDCTYNGIHKRQSGVNKNSLNGGHINTIENIYDTSENIYKPVLPRNRDQTSYFPYDSTRYHYKRNSDRENKNNGKLSRFEDGNRWEGRDYDDLESSWKSLPNNPYVDVSDRNRPLYEPNLADKLAGN